MMFLYFKLLFLIISIASAHMPNITIENNNVPLGTNATFYCTHKCDMEGGCRGIQWTVETKEGILFKTLELDDEMELNSRGIYRDGVLHTKHQENITMMGSTDSSTLDVQASQMNNESEITCSIFLHDDTTDIITLIVIGAPLPPSVHSCLISASEILLQWEEPFSWHGHDILNYTVTVEDNGHTTSVTTNETFYSYTSMSGQVADSCRDILFVVTAFNDVEGAIPIPANHSNGFPIAPKMMGNASIEVLFRKDGIPQVSITIEPPSPPICDYQPVSLKVEISPPGNDTTRLKNYTGSPPEETFIFYLERNRVYNASISVSTLAGNINHTLEFDTIPKPESPILPIIVGVAAGTLVILTLTVLFIFVCCHLMTRPKATQTTDDVALPPMEVNPSKRDTIYETIDDNYQPVINDYQQRTMIPARPESPYQAMTSADVCSPSLQKSFHVFHNVNDSHCNGGGMPNSTYTPNSDVHGTPGGSNGGVPYSTYTPPNSDIHVTPGGSNGGVPCSTYTPPNSDIHVTPGGSILYVSRGSAAAEYSAGAGGEGEYTAMTTPAPGPHHI